MKEPKKKLTQKEMLKKHFENTDNISNIEAQAVYKIRALPRRISDCLKTTVERAIKFNL